MFRSIENDMAIKYKTQNIVDYIEQNGEKKIVHIRKYPQPLGIDSVIEVYKILITNGEPNSIRLVGYRDKVKDTINLYLYNRVKPREVDYEEVKDLIRKYFE